ncbi:MULTISPECIES: winged helix-turn-helix domain-containing protein [unclassified Streptomyces]|uniref:winged helix-turn-helix domain-containing protein n=1 Tax=unclassified Streptomyces TaxID=2593676 RepID=UPI0035D607AE
MMHHVHALGQSIPPTRRQLNDLDRIGDASPVHRQRTDRERGQLVRGLSPRMRRLLLDGDVDGRYAHRNEAEEGYRLTMALAVGASQQGRAWQPADFHRALLYSATSGGTWARRLRERKGTEYAEGKLTGMLLKAREMVERQPAITCRQSGWEAVTRVREAVDSAVWRTKGGGDTDLKNLTVRLGLCERGGGLDHDLSVRRQAELMGCAKQTAANSNERLRRTGWLALEVSGAGSDQSSKWRLKIPAWAGEVSAAPGHPPAAGEGGAGTSVLPVHTDTKRLGRLVGHDAFHRYGHGTSGARLLTLLDATEGVSAKELRDTLGLHRTTVARRLRELLTDGLVVELEGLFYLAPALAGPVGVTGDDQALDEAAVQRGTAGAGFRRRRRHAKERRDYRRWRAGERAKRIVDRLRLVPDGVVDLETGEITDPAWRSWDVSDPCRPVPRPVWAA